MDEQRAKSEVVKVIDEITTLHNEIIGYFKQSLDKALRIGELLIEQKKSLNHGEFGKWIQANLPFTDRTARNYMRIYDNRDKLKTETVSDLTGAYRLLTVTKIIERDTNGDLVESIKVIEEYAKEQFTIQNEAAEKTLRAERDLGRMLKALEEVMKLEEVVRECKRISSEIDNRLQKNKEMKKMIKDNEFNSEMKAIIERDLNEYIIKNAEWKRQIWSLKYENRN